MLFCLSWLSADTVTDGLQEEKPETALERALVDREETVSRLERELERERVQGKSKTSTLQRRLEEALQQGQSATREHETSRMALAAAQMAHDQQMRDADKRQLALRGDLSKMQVRSLSHAEPVPAWAVATHVYRQPDCFGAQEALCTGLCPCVPCFARGSGFVRTAV